MFPQGKHKKTLIVGQMLNNICIDFKNFDKTTASALNLETTMVLIVGVYAAVLRGFFHI